MVLAKDGQSRYVMGTILSCLVCFSWEQPKNSARFPTRGQNQPFEIYVVCRFFTLCVGIVRSVALETVASCTLLRSMLGKSHIYDENLLMLFMTENCTMITVK